MLEGIETKSYTISNTLYNNTTLARRNRTLVRVRKNNRAIDDSAYTPESAATSRNSSKR